MGRVTVQRETDQTDARVILASLDRLRPTLATTSDRYGLVAMDIRQVEGVARIITEPMLRAPRRCLLTHATDALARLHALARQEQERSAGRAG